MTVWQLVMVSDNGYHWSQNRIATHHRLEKLRREASDDFLLMCDAFPASAATVDVPVCCVASCSVESIMTVVSVKTVYYCGVPVVLRKLFGRYADL